MIYEMLLIFLFFFISLYLLIVPEFRKQALKTKINKLKAENFKKLKTKIKAFEKIDKNDISVTITEGNVCIFEMFNFKKCSFLCLWVYPDEFTIMFAYLLYGKIIDSSLITMHTDSIVYNNFIKKINECILLFIEEKKET